MPKEIIRRIPVDITWKTVKVGNKNYLVPDFGAARNKIRKKEKKK